jgi:hypothetical protein
MPITRRREPAHRSSDANGIALNLLRTRKSLINNGGCAKGLVGGWQDLLGVVIHLLGVHVDGDSVPLREVGSNKLHHIPAR